MVELLAAFDWDGLRNWLATIGGLVALFIAVNTYRRNVRHKREEQARLVYSKPSGSTTLKGSEGHERRPDVSSVTVRGGGDGPRVQCWATVSNRSKELIGPVRIEIHPFSRRSIPAFDTVWTRELVIEPESEYTVSFVIPNPIAPKQPAFVTSVLFRDASNQWWRRDGSEPIEAVHDDPAILGYAGEAPRPPLTMRVRRHRFWRRVRGKSPTP